MDDDSQLGGGRSRGANNQLGAACFCALASLLGSALVINDGAGEATVSVALRKAGNVLPWACGGSQAPK